VVICIGARDNTRKLKSAPFMLTPLSRPETLSTAGCTTLAHSLCSPCRAPDGRVLHTAYLALRCFSLREIAQFPEGVVVHFGALVAEDDRRVVVHRLVAVVDVVRLLVYLSVRPGA
jgi:hypothetical protein